MQYCRFCGQELINGRCYCAEYRASVGDTPNNRNQNLYQRTKEPFLIQGFNLNFNSASEFMSSVRDQFGMGEPDLNTNNPYEYNVPIVPNCIKPEENELIVKQYNIAKLRTRLKFMKAEGRLMVTNRRVIFRAAGTSLSGNTLQEHQFDIDKISGIEMHKDYKFSFLSFFGCILLNTLASSATVAIFVSSRNAATVAVGIILGLLGWLPTFVVYKHFWLKLFCAIISSSCFSVSFAASSGKTKGIILILLVLAGIIALIDLVVVCFVPNLVIRIKTEGGNGAVIIGSQKAMFRRTTGDDNSGFAEVMPWEDTIMAMNEIGTMIDDLKKQGDYAVEKWSK